MRAINKIRELKPHIAVFWDSGAQQAQLMKDAEVDMTTGWNGRFDNAKKDGAKVGYTLKQALLDYGAQHLAGYKRPKLIHVVNDYPRTKNGKVLRNQLKQRIEAVA